MDTNSQTSAPEGAQEPAIPPDMEEKKPESVMDLPEGAFNDVVGKHNEILTGWIPWRGKRYKVEYRELGGLEATQLVENAWPQGAKRPTSSDIAFAKLKAAVYRVDGVELPSAFWAEVREGFWTEALSLVTNPMPEEDAKNSRAP